HARAVPHGAADRRGRRRFVGPRERGRAARRAAGARRRARRQGGGARAAVAAGEQARAERAAVGVAGRARAARAASRARGRVPQRGLRGGRARVRREAGSRVEGAVMGAEERLASLGLELPAVMAPAGSYVPARVVGDLIFVSGQGPWSEGG